MQCAPYSAINVIQICTYSITVHEMCWSSSVSSLCNVSCGTVIWFSKSFGCSSLVLDVCCSCGSSCDRSAQLVHRLILFWLRICSVSYVRYMFCYFLFHTFHRSDFVCSLFSSSPGSWFFHVIIFLLHCHHRIHGDTQRRIINITMRNFIICTHPQISLGKQVKSRRMRWAGHVARMGEKRNVYRVLMWKPEENRLEDQGVGEKMGSEWILSRLAGGV
jgi:hypothetical protein